MTPINNTPPTDTNSQQPADEGLDDAVCSSSVLTDGGILRDEPQPMHATEGYPEGWMHCKIHLNPNTGEMHSDGDHRVRHWLVARLEKLRKIEALIIGANAKHTHPETTTNDDTEQSENSNTMKLYLISQTENNDYDTYDSAVVCAPDEETARNTNPGGWQMTEREWNERYYSSWCGSPESVTVKYIGEAAEGLDFGVVCASFNAG